VIRLVVTSVCAKAGSASASVRTAIQMGIARHRAHADPLIKLLLSESNRKEQFRCLGFPLESTEFLVERREEFSGFFAIFHPRRYIFLDRKTDY
jgi:hypothetical protein